jgi:HAD superfamily hydrolase (TIGR01509 family)
MKMTSFAAVIFDMDGTLAHNMPLHFAAFARFMERHRLPVPPPAVAAGLTGKRNREIMPVIFGRALSDEEIARYSEEKELIYHEMIAELGPLPGLVSLLDTLDARSIPFGLATSAPRMNVAPMLDVLGIAGRFAAITLGEEVAHGKPAPDIFLEAARRLRVAPEQCLAFEDAYAGIAAAKAAGMQCVALATTHTPEELRAHAAPDLIIRDYREIMGTP